MRRLCGKRAVAVVWHSARRLGLVLVCMAGTVVAQVSAADQFPVVEIDSLPNETILIDVGALDSCREASLPGAKCIPLDKMLGRNGRLANLRDIRWLLGTAGLTGAETIAIFSRADQDSRADKERDAATGIFFLAGQRKVLRLGNIPMQALSAKGAETALSRVSFYSAIVRTKHLVPAKAYSVKAEYLAEFIENLDQMMPETKFQWPVGFRS